MKSETSCKMVTEYVAAKLWWLTNELNRVSQLISIEYSMVHGLNQTVFLTKHFENLAVLDLSSFSYVLEQVSNVTLSGKN